MKYAVIVDSSCDLVIENKTEKLILTLNLDINKYHTPNKSIIIEYSLFSDDLVACEEFCKIFQRYLNEKLTRNLNVTGDNTSSIDVKLYNLCNLYKAGFLTDAEFEESKQKVIYE